MILSFGGIPLLYYGDEIGTLNDYVYLDDEVKRSDSRWIHRPNIDWDKAELRNSAGSVEQRIFTGLKKMIAVRKEIPAFADFNNRELIAVDNPHLFVFARFDHQSIHSRVLVIGNFDANSQYLELDVLRRLGFFRFDNTVDLISGERPPVFNSQLVIPASSFFWFGE